jgi:hypothetical protein
MPKPILGVFAIIAGLSAPTAASAQEATEIFIPLGQSPGVSNKTSVIGPIESVDERSRTCSITASTGAVTFKVTDRTRIWRDRTLLKQRNEVGTFGDLRKGRKVEVKLEPGEGQRPADWIKVQITEAGPSD